MQMACDEFTMYHSEAALMRIEEAMTMADVILGGGKAIVKGVIERYGPPLTKEATDKAAAMAAFKKGVRERALQGVKDMQRRTLTAVLLNGTEAEYVKSLLDNSSLSKDRVEEIVNEMQEIKARLRAKGKLPQ